MVAGGGLRFLTLVLLLPFLTNPNPALAADHMAVVSIDVYGNSTVNYPLNKPGPYHALTAGAAGYMHNCTQNSNGSSQVIKCAQEQVYVAALTSDGSVAVYSDYAQNYPKNVLSGNGWTDIAMAGISNYELTSNSPWDSSKPTFWMAGLDSSGQIHTTPAFTKHGGQLPSGTGPYKKIIAMQNRTEGGAPALAAIDMNSKIHLPAGMTTDLQTKWKYSTAEWPVDGLRGVTMSGGYTCTLNWQGNCDDMSNIHAPSTPKLQSGFGYVGPYIDLATGSWSTNAGSGATQVYLLDDKGKLPVVSGTFSEIAGATVGYGNRPTIFGIVGAPVSNTPKPLAVQMPSTGMVAVLPMAAGIAAGLGVIVQKRRY